MPLPDPFVVDAGATLGLIVSPRTCVGPELGVEGDPGGVRVRVGPLPDGCGEVGACETGVLPPPKTTRPMPPAPAPMLTPRATIQALDARERLTADLR